MVSTANTLGILCATNEISDPVDFSNTVFSPIQNWLATNATKRPAYVVLFQDIPTRVKSGGTAYPSTQVQINSACAPGWQPFVTSINMDNAGGSSNCIGYIKKLASFGSHYSQGNLIISASAGWYPNNNWYFDGTSPNYGTNILGVSGAAVTNVLANASVTYLDDTNYPAIGILAGHITGTLSGNIIGTNVTNVAAFSSWGAHGYFGGTIGTNYYPVGTNWGYATNGTIQFTGASGWYLIETMESFNGQQSFQAQGNFISWYSSNAFGGIGYSNTPVGAVCNVEEPTVPGLNNPAIYFGDWAAGRILPYCAWNSAPTGANYLQVVGDPFIKR